MAVFTVASVVRVCNSLTFKILDLESSFLARLENIYVRIV